jgi:hypothetical protein
MKTTMYVCRWRPEGTLLNLTAALALIWDYQHLPCTDWDMSTFCAGG